VLAWPPSYNLKVSNKAKYLQLKIIYNCVLQVIIPSKQAKKITPQMIGDLLESKKHWINKYLILNPEVALPTELALFNGELLNVTYQAWHTNTTKLLNQHVLIKSNDPSKYKILLIKWLKNYAKQVLTPLVHKLAQLTQLIPAKVNVKEQKNLWGNCSSQKIINLNYKLLFLPLHLVQHVILHELAHLEQLNHSTKFWNLLQKLDPHALENDHQLKSANQYVPRWLF